MSQTAESVVGAAAKAYPLSVAAASFAGYSLQDWVYITAIAVAVCQLIREGWKFVQWLRKPKP